MAAGVSGVQPAVSQATRRPDSPAAASSATIEGLVRDIRALSSSDIWINGGFFVMRKEIFEYMRPGEELVREPFQRLVEKKEDEKAPPAPPGGGMGGMY